MLIQTLIAQICVGLPTVNYTACAKAFEAASTQTQVAQEINTFEAQLAGLAYRRAVETAGKTAVVVLGVAAKAITDRAITCPIKSSSHGVIPSVSTTVGVDGGSLLLGWQF